MFLAILTCRAWVAAVRHLCVAALLMANEHEGNAVHGGQPAHHGRVIQPRPVAMQLYKPAGPKSALYMLSRRASDTEDPSWQSPRLAGLSYIPWCTGSEKRFCRAQAVCDALHWTGEEGRMQH